MPFLEWLRKLACPMSNSRRSIAIVAATLYVVLAGSLTRGFAQSPPAYHAHAHAASSSGWSTSQTAVVLSVVAAVVLGAAIVRSRRRRGSSNTSNESLATARDDQDAPWRGRTNRRTFVKYGASGVVAAG